MKRLSAILVLCLAACSIGGAEKHWNIAEEFEKQGQYLRAIEEYSRIVNMGQRNPIAIKAQVQIARIYDKNLHDYPRAIRAYRDAYRRSEDKRTKMESRWAIADIYSNQLQNSPAASEEYQALFQELARGQKEGPEVLLTWAKSLMDAGKFDESAVRYEEFRKLYPGHKEGPRTLLEEGHARLADRRPDQAMALFREFITKFGGVNGYTSMVAEAYYGLGSALEAQDELSAALEAFRASLSTYPNPKVIELKIQRVEKRKKERRL